MRAILLSAALLAATSAAHAQSVQALSEGGRYQLMDVNDKIVRLDTETGGFEVCRPEGGEWACVVARDERAELKQEIDRLAARLERVEGVLAERQQAEAEMAAKANKGIAARLYDYVPSIGW